MSMTDPIADLLTRIRNGQSARKSSVTIASSKVKMAILAVLKDEGYIADFNRSSDESKPVLTIELKYYEGRPVIDRIERVSRRDCAYTVARMKFRACSAAWALSSSRRPRAS